MVKHERDRKVRADVKGAQHRRYMSRTVGLSGSKVLIGVLRKTNPLDVGVVKLEV